MSNDITIRQPLRLEYDHIADLWFDSWLSTGLGHTSNVSKDDLRQRLDREDEWDLLVAVRGGQIDGMLALKPRISKLDQIFVRPDCRRQGIGRHLMADAKARLPKGLWLKVHRLNHAALRFYRSEGFDADLARSQDVKSPDDLFLKWEPSC